MLKKLTILVIGILLTSPAWSATPTSGFSYDEIADFSGGQTSHVNPYDIPPKSGSIVQNARTDKVYGGLSKRDALNDYLSYGSNPINGLYRYYQNNNNAWNLVAIGTTLMSDTGGVTPTSYTIKDGLTTSKRWTFITYQNIVYGGDGTDPNIKWDGVSQITANTNGSRSANELVSEMGAPFATLATGTGPTAAKWYLYKMAYYDGTNYYYSSARSNAILTGSTVTAIKVSSIPLGLNTVVHRYIYRTNGDASMSACYSDSTYYLVKDIADNSTTSFTDTLADSSGATPTWATVSAGTSVTPLPSTIFESAQSRIWLTSLSNLYFSDTAHPEFFLASNYIAVRPDDGDVITFVKNNLGALTIGKTNTIQKAFVSGAPYTSSGTFNWFFTDPYSYVGCPAQYSVASTPIGIIYLARNGLYVFGGNKSELLSDSIADVINDISPANIALTSGYYFNNEYRLAYTSLSSGGTSNNRVLLYDTIRQAYVVDTESINCFATQNSGLDFGILYSGSSTSDGFVTSQTLSTSGLNIEYKTDIDAGTFVSVNDIYTVDNSDPIMQLGWTGTNATLLATLQTYSASINTNADIITYMPNATNAQPALSGTWTSPVYQVNAKAFSQLFWNEYLSTFGTVGFQIRTGNTATPDGSWTSYNSTPFTNPNGSSLTGLTAGTYAQVKITFTTSNNQYTPAVFQANGYVFSIAYTQTGVPYETSILSVYQTGWKEFSKGNSVQIDCIKVFYTGTSGTLNFNYQNDEGDVSNTFTIDLSVTGPESTQQYTNAGNSKVFTFLPPVNSSTNPSPIGQYFMYTITENGTVPWSIQRIETEFSIVPEY